MSSHYNEILSSHLNKYMINIIYDYVVPNIDKLKNISNTRISILFKLKIPFFDIVIKAIHLGFMGISISKYHYRKLFKNVIKDKDNEFDKRLEMTSNNDFVCFKLKGHYANLYYRDICYMLDIFEYEEKIRSNSEIEN
jgi:hypothetical protein